MVQEHVPPLYIVHYTKVLRSHSLQKKGAVPINHARLRLEVTLTYQVWFLFSILVINSWTAALKQACALRADQLQSCVPAIVFQGRLRKDLCTFVIISWWILLRMRNVSDKSCSENQKTGFMFNRYFPKKHAIYEIMWKNMVEPYRPPMTI
jgi:hypothetical protein